MSSVICTLFEGHYHHGVAALLNSLIRQGFTGSFYAGYRGELPKWADDAYENSKLNWPGGKTLKVLENVELNFLPLETDYHFSNYKPDFMLRLWDGPAIKANGMYYFDPDIIVVQKWLLFEEWITCGVAVCEDVNSPLSRFHPRRVAWRRYFSTKGINLNFKNEIYVNSGFIGLNIEDKEILSVWKHIQETMAPLIGGLNRSIFKMNHYELLEKVGGPFKPFLTTDQDALNATIEVSDRNISFIGKGAMGFENGFNIIHHALGSPKPWKWHPFSMSLKGKPPRKVDVEFWIAAEGPIRSFGHTKVLWNSLAIKITRAIGRFYSRK